MATQIGRGALRHQPDDVVGAMAKLLDRSLGGEVETHVIDVSPSETREIEGGLAHGLARHRTADHRPAGPTLPIDDRDAPSPVRSLRGRLLTRGAGAEHDEVVVG